MLDDHLVRLVAPHRVRQLVAESRAQPIAVTLHVHQTPIEPRLDANLVHAPAPDDLLGVRHLHREMAVEPEERDVGSGEANLLRRGERGVTSGAVVDDHLLARPHRTAENVPDAGAVLGAVHPVEIRDASGRDDHDVGITHPDFFGLDEPVETHIDAEPQTLAPRGLRRRIAARRAEALKLEASVAGK